MRMADRFSRRIRGYAKANGIPVVDCGVGERKHDIAEQYLAKTKVARGLFLILVGRAQAPVWDVSANHHNRAKEADALCEPLLVLTIFKLHCGRLTLKIYTKGERVLRFEVVVHNTQELRCGRSLEKFPEIVVEAKSILERFMDALGCIDQCFIADRMLEQLPAPSQVGKTKVGGIDLNKARMRWVVQAVIALSLSPSPGGFTASELASQVRVLNRQSLSEYGARRAAYDLSPCWKRLIAHLLQDREVARIPCLRNDV
jgi:hypothetical protein